MEDFGFADPEDLFFYCSEASVSRPGDGFEVAFAAADFRRKILAVIKVIVELDLPEKQREIFKLRYLNGALPTEESIASYLGCTKQNVGKVCGKALDLVEKRIRGALNEEGDLRYDAGEYLCRHFFRTLKNRGLDDRKKLAEVGVVFNNDPGVDLSGAGDNTFNVAVFRDLDGVFISGFDFLDKREVSSIFELFEKIDGGGLLVLPQADEENKEGVTPEKIIITAREFGNLKRLKELTGISFDSKTGKWIIEITGTSFNKKWFLGSEKKLLGGYMLLKYCNLLCDQNGIKKFFEMVFGSENMVFIEDPNDGKNAVDSLVRKLHAQF